MSESAGTKKLTADILVQAPKRFPGVRVWKSATGTGVPLGVVRAAIKLFQSGRIKEGAQTLMSRLVHYGVTGQADLSGITPLGAPGGGGRFIQIEVKFGDDVMSDEQINWRAMILRAGGIHVIARELEQAMRDLGEQI